MATHTHDPSLVTQPLISERAKTKLRKPLRLWPGIALAILILALRFIAPAVGPEKIGEMPLSVIAAFGGLFASLAILLWWLIFSRAPWLERLAVFVVMAAGLFLTYRLVHPSIAGAAMGFWLGAMSLPVVSVALVAWAAGSRRLAATSRRLSMVVVIFLAFSVFTVIRTGGFNGDFKNDLHWRWTRTPEEQLLAKGEEATVAAPAAATVSGREWPGFRGAHRDGVVPGVRLETDWAKAAPKEMWRRPVGPG